MPRTSRISFENAFYHVFNRGLNKQNIFFDTDDYNKFFQILTQLKTKNHYDHAIYSYVLMPSHFHLLIQTKKVPIATIMKTISIRYVVYLNKKYNRVGILFQNRFKSKLCDKDVYFLGVSRYIHLNPVVAGLVHNAESYPWSSLEELLGTSERSIIDREEVLRLLDNSVLGKISYQEFLLGGIKNWNELEKEYSFESDVGGSPRFNTLSQKKYLRRKKKKSM